MVLALDKSDPRWNISLNTPAICLKGILLLIEDPAAGAIGPAFGRNSEFYYNPLISRVQIAEVGVPYQLYARGMHPYQQWEEIMRSSFTRTSLVLGFHQPTSQRVFKVGTPCGSISAAPMTADCTGRAVVWGKVGDYPPAR